MLNDERNIEILEENLNVSHRMIIRRKGVFQKLPRYYGDFTIAFVAALLAICILIFSMTTNSTTRVSALETNGVGVYWDSKCSNAVSSIDWSTLVPRSVKNILVYIRNEGEEPMYLILSTKNWNPPEASEYLNLRWNHTEGRQMNPGEDLQITLTLSVSPYIEGISSFSFDIIVTGSDRLMGDVNGDGWVDWKDLLLELFPAYNSHGPGIPSPGDPASPTWNPNCDFNDDNWVDWKDYLLVFNPNSNQNWP